MAGTRAYIKYIKRIEKDRQRKLQQQQQLLQQLAAPAAAAAAAPSAAPVPVELPVSQNSSPIWDDDAAALVIGIEYTRYASSGRMERLPGCHKDVQTVRGLLKDVYKVSPSFTKVLSDNSTSSTLSVVNALPSADNIRRGIAWLLQTKKKKLFLFYSGHGSHIRDSSSDEADGRDEVIVPDDYLSAGYITDDYLHEKLVKPAIAASAHLTCVFDCCHSGSLLDLPYYYSTQDGASKKQKAGTDAAGAGVSAEGNIVSISACSDFQTSVSATNMDSRRREWQGALTFAFDKAVRDTVGDGTLSNALGLAPSVDGKKLIIQIGDIISSKGFYQITTLSTNIADPSARISVPA